MGKFLDKWKNTDYLEYHLYCPKELGNLARREFCLESPLKEASGEEI